VTRMRSLSFMAILVILMAAASASARNASHHSKHAVVSKHQPAPMTKDRGGVERHPDDVALDRKIGSICRGC
jgi:hypothetical protein